MNAKLLGFFSGFPTRCFTDDIANVLRRELNVRKSLVFVSSNPDNYAQNDADAYGMHKMFVEKDMPFDKYFVIDDRTKASDAANLICDASCIFLMGGNATRQFKLMREKGLLNEIRQSSAVILGVSAGAMNMGGPVIDIYESPIPYDGLEFMNITIKAHYPFENENLLKALQQVSMEYPICLMADESAVFVRRETVTQMGEIYWMDKGNISLLTQMQLEQMRKRG